MNFVLSNDAHLFGLRISRGLGAYAERVFKVGLKDEGTVTQGDLQVLSPDSRGALVGRASGAGYILADLRNNGATQVSDVPYNRFH